MQLVPKYQQHYFSILPPKNVEYHLNESYLLKHSIYVVLILMSLFQNLMHILVQNLVQTKIVQILICFLPMLEPSIHKVHPLQTYHLLANQKRLHNLLHPKSKVDNLQPTLEMLHNYMSLPHLLTQTDLLHHY